MARKLGITSDDFAPATWLLRQTLENPWLIPFSRESHVRNLVILLRNAAFFTLAGSLSALGAALPAGPVTIISLVFTTLFLIACLVTRWMSFQTLWPVVPAVMGLLVLHVWAWRSDPPLAARASAFLAAFLILVITAGIMGYYNCCTVMLDAHFANTALRIASPIEDDITNVSTLQIATSMIARAVERAENMKES